MEPYLSSGFMLLRGQTGVQLNRGDCARSISRECYGSSVLVKEEMGLSKVGHNRRLNRGAVPSLFVHSGCQSAPRDEEMVPKRRRTEVSCNPSLINVREGRCQA